MKEEQKFRNPEAILDIHDRPKPLSWLGLSLQHLFTMFGATVLVPILVGLEPSIALFSSGVGTLLYILITKGTVPAYLGSSFAFITAMQALMSSEGYPAVAQGIIYSGIVYVIVALLIAKIGSAWIDRILPPIVVGPVIMVIGLGLASNAAQNAMFNNGNYDTKYILVALVTLALTIFFNMYLKGFMSLIPILLGIIGGYLFALTVGIVDLEPVKAAPWLSAPDFQVMFVDYDFKFSFAALTSMAPIALVTMTEHMGHLMVLSKLTKRDFFENPGLKKTLLADGLSTIIGGFIFDEKRNLVITAAILVIGIGGAYLQIGSFQLTSMALATLIGIVLNLVLPTKARSEVA